jgi:Tol biopolymer transport system component
MQYRIRSKPALACRAAALVPFALAACAETSQTVLMPDDLAFQAHVSRWSEWSEATDAPFAAINTPAATEGCPFVTQSGKLLVFASNRAGGFGALDLYLSHWDASRKQWGEPVNMGSTVNTGANEQCPLLSADGKELLFVSNRAGGAGGLDLWMTRRGDKRSDFDWEPAVNLGAVNTDADEFGPSWYKEGGRTVLYFNSNRGGNHDFYVSTASRDGTFPAATPAVGLNTTSQEQFAALSKDGLEIFFSSDRPGGFGALDLWRATRPRTSAAWSTPENLGSAVNSAAAEGRSALSWDGKTLYFHSNRAGSVDLFQSSRSR